MKMKLLLAIAIVWASQASSQAQGSITVNFGAGPNQPDVVDQGGSPLADGNYVRLGCFDPGFNLLANANNMTALSGAWNEFGFTTIRPIFGQPGRFAATLSGSDPLFDGQQMWLWILRTAGDTAPAPDMSNVMEYGVYSSTAPNWLFPAQGTVPPGNTASVNSSEVDQAAFGSFDANHLFLEVPEPSAFGLFTIGLALFSAFRLQRRPRTRQVGK
jgi:hypothetical protein